MVYLLFLSVQIFFAVFIFFLCLSFVTGAPFVPSLPKAARSMINAAHLKKGETVYDLGSGNGNLLLLAAAKGTNAIGLEINPILVLFTRLRILFSPYRSTIRVYWKNFWSVSYAHADVVFIYLLPWRMKELAVKLARELPPGARIVSNSFLFPDWKTSFKDTANHVYVYTIAPHI